jgi:hypothetical protein
MDKKMRKLVKIIKNSTDKRYALKDEAGVVQNVTISYEGGGVVGGSSGEGGLEIKIFRNDITKNYNGLTDQEVIDLVESKTADIANATTAIQHPTLNTVTNYITIYNETAPITNNTIWKDEVEVQSYNKLWSQVIPITNNRFVVAHYYYGGFVYQINTDGTITQLATLRANGAICTTFDGKRIITRNDSNTYQYDLQDDGTYVQTDITRKVDHRHIGYLYYGGNYSHLRWDGQVLYALGHVYKIAEDGSWVQDNTIPNMIRKLDSASYVDWINFVLPDLSLNMVYKSRGYDNKVHFFSLQNDGTYAEDPILDLGDNKIIYGQLTLDGKKLVCTIKDTNSKYAIETYYRNDDKTWSFISRNYSRTYQIENNAIVLTLDGSKILARTTNYKLLMFEQQVDSDTLDANSTDPFGDGSLKHSYKLNNDLNDSVGTLNAVAVGNITYQDVSDQKINRAAYLNDNDDGFKIVPTEDIKTISFWTKADRGIESYGIMPVYNTSSGLFIYVQTDDTNAHSKFNLGYDGKTDYDNGLPKESIDDRFYHVLLTHDGSNLKLYIDGSLDKIISSSKIPAPTNSELRMGYSYNDQYRYKGWISELKLFDRVLTDDEITQLYNAQG